MNRSFDLYILRLAPFDFFEVKWLNYHILLFCGFKDIGKNIEIHGGKLQRKRGENDLIIVFRASQLKNLKGQHV